MKVKKCFFIPARAGSKGVKNKNILDLNGKMLFEWSVFSAYNSMGNYDRIYISTNSQEILNWHKDVVQNHPSEHVRENIFVIERPEHLCEDNSSTEAAILDAMKNLLANGIEIDDIVLLQPTSPFRTDDIVGKCVKAYYENKSRLTVFSASKNTPFNWKNQNGVFTPTYNFKERKMRQNLAEGEFNWHEDGNVYVFSSHSILSSNNRMTEHACAVENNTINSIQIDNYDEMEMAKAISKINKVDLWMKTIMF